MKKIFKDGSHVLKFLAKILKIEVLLSIYDIKTGVGNQT